MTLTTTYEELTGVVVFPAEGEPYDALFEEDTAGPDVELIDLLAGKVVDSEVSLDYGYEDLDLLPFVVTEPKTKFSTPGAGHTPKNYK